MAKFINLTDHKKNSNNTIKQNVNEWNEWHSAICAGHAIISAKKAGFTEEQINALIFQLEDNTDEEASEAYLQWLNRQ